MNVMDLNRNQLIELKQRYMIQLANEGNFAEMFCVDYDSPSWVDMENADRLVPDSVIFEHYDGIDFIEGDFFCSMDSDSVKKDDVWEVIHMIDRATWRDDVTKLDRKVLEGLLLDVYEKLVSMVR